MKVLIDRLGRYEHKDKQTLGMLYIFNDRSGIQYTCCTLELADRDNKPRESCIPVGEYKVVKRNSPKYGDHFHILDVENRSYILIHNANYVRQLLGCVAVGKKHIDIDGDGLLDVTSSKATMKELNEILPDEFDLEIRWR